MAKLNFHHADFLFKKHFLILYHQLKQINILVKTTKCICTFNPQYKNVFSLCNKIFKK